MTIRFSPPATAAAATMLTKQPLVIDGTLVREGSAGSVLKVVGYNTHIIPGVYNSAMTLDTPAKLDDFFSKQQPNSMHRVEAFAPGSGSGHTDAEILGLLANARTVATKYGQRLVPRMTNWTTVGSTPGVVDRFDNKSATWFTSQLYKNSVSGSTSFEDWTKAVVAVFLGDGIGSIFDILNEPQCSSGNAASAAAFVTYMRNVIKAVDPTALVMMGVNVVGVVGGASSYQTIAAGTGGVGLDICSGHNYSPYGFVNSADPILVAAQALGKPYWIDEHGMISKGYYGSSSDSDRDSSGRPAVPTDAQAQQVERFLKSALAIPECIGVCYYSWPGAQTDGLAHVDPIAGSLTRKVIRNVPLDGDGFSFESLGAVAAWIDGAQNTLTQPGVTVANWFMRHANNSAALTGSAPTSGRFVGLPSFRFSGAQSMDVTAWKTGSAVFTGHMAIAPLVLPTAGAYAYLTGPQSLTGLGSGVRINSSGQVEVIKTSASNSTAGTVMATSTNSVDLDVPNVVQWQWDTGSGAVLILLNGVLTTATGATASLTVGNARLGNGADGLNGFTGHIFEGIYQTFAETLTNIFLAAAYLTTRYKEKPITGTGKTYTDQQIAAVTTGFAPLASPTFTGTPAAPTAALTDSSTKLATTAFVDGYAVPIPRFAFTTGDCWVLAGQSGTPSTLLLVEGREYAIPFYVPEAVTITTLAVEVTTASTAASTGVIRLGIRAHDTTTGKPTTVLVDAGTVVSTSAVVVSATLGTPLALTPGWYWYSVVGQGAPATQATVRSIVAGSVLYPSPLRLASFAALGTAAQQLLFQNSQAGALGTFTSAGTLSGGPRLMAQAQ